jgi:hypothetical protein
LIVDVWPTVIEVGVNDIASVGASDGQFAVAPLPLGRRHVAGRIRLRPDRTALTSTISAHEAPAASVTPEMLTVEVPATATGVPPHELLMLFGVPTLMSDGSVSLIEMPCSVPGLLAGLVIVSVIVVVEFNAIAGAP